MDRLQLKMLVLRKAFEDVEGELEKKETTTPRKRQDKKSDRVAEAAHRFLKYQRTQK